jgi:DNA-directed RNA polymerase subunit RPC12/RpoP
MNQLKVQYECIDEHCKTIYFGEGKGTDLARCPKCNGRVVRGIDLSTQVDNTSVEVQGSKLNAVVSVKDIELFMDLVKLLKDVSESGSIPSNFKELIQNRIGHLININNTND